MKESIPRKWVEPLVPEDLPELTYPSYFNDLDKAKLQIQRGRYKLALATLAKATDIDPIEAAMLNATALSVLGRTEQAVETLSTDAMKDQPRAQVLRATILASTGKTDDALSLLKQHLDAHPDSLIGHFQLGQVSEQVGDLETAKKAYGWFVQDAQLLDKWQGQTGEDVFESADSVTIIGHALDRWATLTGAYKDGPSLHNNLLNMFVKAYDVIDRGYPPAHVAAAEDYLSHDDKSEAGKELEIALNANPRDVAGLRLAALIALDNFNFDGVDQLLDSLRAIDHNSTTADLLESRSLLHQRRPKEAFAPIERVLAKQPKNLEALGLLAAAHSLRLEDDKAAATLKQVEQIDPDNATAYFEVAEQLGSMRQYPRAAEHYKVAIDRASWWTAPRNGLGLLYTQSGDEDDARVTLDAAHALDPYNLATTNYLRLLDDMARFARSETEHFVVFYDAAEDPVIPEYFGEYLESIHKEVTANFKHEPTVKTFIEVFPTHD
ncbi:MAG: tetratricopeptide repeat protein, partial [Tepidisphaeraceae bacterium]